jgi:hypothetical protein
MDAKYTAEQIAAAVGCTVEQAQEVIKFNAANPAPKVREEAGKVTIRVMYPVKEQP